MILRPFFFQVKVFTAETIPMDAEGEGTEERAFMTGVITEAMVSMAEVRLPKNVKILSKNSIQTA